MGEGGAAGAPGDVDGDGHADLTVSREAEVVVISGPIARCGPLDVDTEQAVVDALYAPEASHVGDFDGDGFDDLLLLSLRDASLVYGPIQGRTAPADAPGIDLYTGFTSAAGAGDVDGDGRDDVVLGDIGDETVGIPFAGAAFVVEGGI